LPATSSIKAFDKSGRISSFYLCNVGSDGIANGETKDDCTLINLGTGQPYNAISGLSKSESKVLVDKAVKAVNQASIPPKKGATDISILGQVMKIGSPAADIAGMQCQDFMSPQDCKILFNLCDPVICPSDRCDLGGEYPVKDPIQTGIIGGLVLCLPNWREGVYLPVCLSAIKAGIDGLLSIQGSYRDCLQESLDTGQTVGICDEMHSVYLCEFFWKQALPLAEVGLPKLIAAVAGQTSARGGSKYLGIQNAWDTSKGSMDFFVKTYATNAFNAFKARSTEEIGASVCKNFASGVVPNLDFLESFAEPDSPYQFHGRYDEIPFSSTTNPPTSHYKVFYHIYAGQDSSGQYKVFLKGSSDSTYFQDASGSRLVAQGYMKKGETISETKDFTAPSGYKELCINVNGQEECGFKQVSTSFALDYAKDKYIEQQTTQTDIQSEQECISGTASAYNLLTPNIQEGAQGLIDPGVYNYGIIRVCATNNPGQGSDTLVGTNRSRWIEVGNCGTQNLKCWLDTSKIDEITTLNSAKDNILSTITEKTLETMDTEESEDVNEIFNDIRYGRITNDDELLSKINEIIDKVFFNHQKAKLYYARGGIYHTYARDAFLKLKKEESDPIAEEKAKTIPEADELDKVTDEPAEDESTSESIFDEDEQAILNEVVESRDVTGSQDCRLCGNGWFNICGELECNAISEKVKEKTGGAAGCNFVRVLSIDPCRPDSLGIEAPVPSSSEDTAIA